MTEYPPLTPEQMAVAMRARLDKRNQFVARAPLTAAQRQSAELEVRQRLAAQEERLSPPEAAVAAANARATEAVALQLAAAGRQLPPSEAAAAKAGDPQAVVLQQDLMNAIEGEKILGAGHLSNNKVMDALGKLAPAMDDTRINHGIAAKIRSELKEAGFVPMQQLPASTKKVYEAAYNAGGPRTPAEKDAWTQVVAGAVLECPDRPGIATSVRQYFNPASSAKPRGGPGCG